MRELSLKPKIMQPDFLLFTLVLLVLYYLFNIEADFW